MNTTTESDPTLCPQSSDSLRRTLNISTSVEVNRFQDLAIEVGEYRCLLYWPIVKGSLCGGYEPGIFGAAGVNLLVSAIASVRHTSHSLKVFITWLYSGE